MVMEDCRVRLVLSARQRCILQGLVRRTHCPQTIVLRAKVLLVSEEGLGPTEVGQKLGGSRERVRRWRDRFGEVQAAWGSDAQEWDDDTLNEKIVEVLEDRERSGAPAKFAPEQLCQIMALACEKRPEECGRPVSHWTARELADEAVKRQIVPGISPRQVGRFLKKWTCGRTRRVIG